MRRVRTGGRRIGISGIVVALALLALIAPGAGATPPQILDPIGGGYSNTTLSGFVQTAIDHATGSTVRILVIPSAYAHTSLGYAQPHVDDLQADCVALLGSGSRFSGGCDTELVPLWTRDDAYDQANVAALADGETDGIFFLGGDQDAAMEIIAGTPTEDAMSADYARGVVFSGTSAGDAVESRNMLADYANGGNPGNALQQDKVSVWWGDDGDLQRGLSFGSQNVIFDQHFDQRGRFGRLLNVTAQTVDRFGGAGLLGAGVNFETSVHLTNDTLLDGVVGNNGVDLIDFSHASYHWAGPDQTLSARNVVTQVMAAGNYSYNVLTRTPMIGSTAVSYQATGAWDKSTLKAPGKGTLILGGDLLAGGDGLSQFVSRAQQSGRSRIVIVVAGYGGTGDAGSAANAYSQALNGLGWKTPADTIQVINFEAQTDWARVQASVVDGAAGVIFVGGDQAQMARPLADTTFLAMVKRAVASAPVVLTDRAMTPVMGDWYVAAPDPGAKDVEDSGIAAFQASYAGNVRAGLGVVHGAFEPRLTDDQRWGRLYSLAMAHPSTIVFGISEQTGILLSPGSASVIGARSVVALDGRAAIYQTGTNGAYTAFNVLMNLYAPGEAVTR